ncbi:HTH-type transcriptional activator RhaS [Paenibacillus plantiphilus]|uniref:HTH-type transcriptional activator RhaS n=1 Tax=Paenibacillus plantiphilus TaxID=2905650 RepID=A0ABM9BNI8_9BACL|nr:helix-turn-helix domain-containing protein [Paenibacillus plantiphilus]CAH1190186.1 HTH-type transcriptional activator RhaS [Paenibacillus plantiphilus]
MGRYLYSYRAAQQLNILADDPGFRLWTETYMLIAVTGGKGEVHIDGREWLAQRDSLFMCNPDRMLEIKAVPKHDLVLHLVHFHILEEDSPSGEPMLYRERRTSWQPDGPLDKPSPTYRIIMIMKELTKLMESADDGGEIGMNMRLHEILQLMISGGKPGGESGQPNERIQAAVDYMQQNYKEEITRESIAAMTGFHPRFFSSLFRKETGFGFSEYLTNLRINKAKEQLLLSRGRTLNDIARDVGYSNGLYLSRKFKQVVGVAPSAYGGQPKRIVVYDWVGNLLALGIKPVGASFPYGLDSLKLLKDELEGIPDIGRTSVNSMLELEPELIIASDWLYPQLIKGMQKVAPTLVVQYGDPFERFKDLAEILDRQEEARAFISRYEEQAMRAKELIAEAVSLEETVALYEIGNGCIWILNEFHGRGGYNLYRSLGLTPPAIIQEHVLGRGRVRSLPLEKLPDYAADHMIVSVSSAVQDRAETERLLAHEVWKQIPAYRNNRIYRVDKQLFYPFDVYSLSKQLEIQTKLFLSRK